MQASQSFLSLMSGRKLSLTSAKDGISSEKLEKRRATNRRTQQKARERKELLIRELQEENDRLRSSLQNHNPPSYSSGTPPSVTLGATSTPLLISHYNPTVDLEACRQGFLAVLSSVCDPHLNTIHAVCQKFAQIRGSTSIGPTLSPPRPVNQPLNVWRLFCTTETDSTFQSTIDSTIPLDFNVDFNNLSPPSAFIPDLGAAGPLTVPFLELPHPTFDLEMDANDIWTCILGAVDISRTDVEALATRVTEKVRCYGFGPVVLQRDVLAVCQEFPRLVINF